MNNAARDAFIQWLTPEANKTLCLIANVLDLDENLEFTSVKIAKEMFRWWEVGSTKFVFTIPTCYGYVFKIPLFRNSWGRSIEDQCKAEYENYLRAKEDGVEEFFAATEPLQYTLHSSVGDAEIYISKDVNDDGWEDDMEEEPYSKDILREANSLICCTDDEVYFPSLSAIAHLIKTKVSEKKILQLLDFMVKYNISDIHSGNYVLTDTGMVFMDYSSED